MPLWRLFHLTPPKGAWRLVEFLPLIIFIAVGIYVTRPKSSEVTQPEYRPIVVSSLTVFGDGPFIAGGFVTIQNGICNKSSNDIVLEISLGFQLQDTDPVISGSGATEPVYNAIQYPIKAKSCLADEKPYILKIPDTIKEGNWRIYAIVLARGKLALEMQRETLISKNFHIKSITQP